MTIPIAKNVLLVDDFTMAVSVLAIASFALPISFTMAVSVLAIASFALPISFTMAVSVLAIASFALPTSFMMIVSVLAIVVFTSPKPAIICSRVVCKLFSTSRSSVMFGFHIIRLQIVLGVGGCGNSTNGYNLSFLGWRIYVPHLCSIHFLAFAHADEITHPIMSVSESISTTIPSLSSSPISRNLYIPSASRLSLITQTETPDDSLSNISTQEPVNFVSKSSLATPGDTTKKHLSAIVF